MYICTWYIYIYDIHIYIYYTYIYIYIHADLSGSIENSILYVYDVVLVWNRHPAKRHSTQPLRMSTLGCCCLFGWSLGRWPAVFQGQTDFGIVLYQAHETPGFVPRFDSQCMMRRQRSLAFYDVWTSRSTQAHLQEDNISLFGLYFSPRSILMLNSILSLLLVSQCPLFRLLLLRHIRDGWFLCFVSLLEFGSLWTLNLSCLSDVQRESGGLNGLMMPSLDGIEMYRTCFLVSCLLLYSHAAQPLSCLFLSSHC